MQYKTSESNLTTPNNLNKNNQDFDCGAFCERESNFWLFPKGDGEVKSNWWEYLFVNPFRLLMLFTLFVMMRTSNRASSKKQDLKNKLKYFNPLIKKDFLGNYNIEWVGRDKPLTEDEVEALWKS